VQLKLDLAGWQLRMLGVAEDALNSVGNFAFGGLKTWCLRYAATNRRAVVCEQPSLSAITR
jgi:hypothetical protein